ERGGLATGDDPPLTHHFELGDQVRLQLPLDRTSVDHPEATPIDSSGTQLPESPLPEQFCIPDVLPGVRVKLLPDVGRDARREEFVDTWVRHLDDLAAGAAG